MIPELHGIVKWWDTKKGYGYITCTDEGMPENGKDYFCHFSKIESDHRFKKLGDGWEVVFTIKSSDKGDMVGWCKTTKVVKPEAAENAN